MDEDEENELVKEKLGFDDVSTNRQKYQCKYNSGGLLLPVNYRRVSWQRDHMTRSKTNTSLRYVTPTLRDKILTIKMMEIFEPDFNATFVDRVERCL